MAHKDDVYGALKKVESKRIEVWNAERLKMLLPYVDNRTGVPTVLDIIFPEGEDPRITPEPESKVPKDKRRCFNCYHRFEARCQLDGKGYQVSVALGQTCDYWKESNNA